VLVAALLAMVGSANGALTLANEYEVTASAVNVASNTWQFTYHVTNVNQGVPGYPFGLDGFAIQVPDSAAVEGWTVPPSYAGSSGYWDVYPPAATIMEGIEPDPGYQWMLWWGFHTPSVYPPGTTATFTVTLSNVSVGSNDAGLVTYWGGHIPQVEYYTSSGDNYTTYLTELPSPVSAVTAIPEPSALVLVATGLAGLLGIARRRFPEK